MKELLEKRIAELTKELEYQTGERISAEDVQRFNGYRLMAIKQHIKTIGEEIRFLEDLRRDDKS
jgi:hypothetical protein